MALYVVGRANEIPDGARKIITVRGREIGIFNIGGRFFALRNRCAHQGGPVCEGAVLAALHSSRPGEYEFNPSRFLLECPWHGWEFELETGQSWFDPQRTKVRRYPIRVEAAENLEIDQEMGLTKGPYLLETYPVTLETNLIVLELTD